MPFQQDASDDDGTERRDGKKGSDGVTHTQ